MRVSTARIAGILVTGLCLYTHGRLYAHGQTTASKEAPVNETKGMPPRAAASDYQAQAQAGKVTIAAEFLGHSVPRAEGPLSTEDYVVVETAFFGPPDERIRLSIEDFSLRINGKKTPLSSQPYGLVARSIKDPEWAPPVSADAKSKSSFGTGNQTDSSSPPPPVHVPIELQRAMAHHLQSASLPEGDRVLPQAGLIFFQYRGKTQSIRSLELSYAGPAGKAKLTLQP